MKIIIEFNTEKDEDFNLHKIYLKAEDMAGAISDIKEMFRKKIKYGEYTDSQFDAIDSLSEEFFEIINNYGVNKLDE